MAVLVRLLVLALVATAAVSAQRRGRGGRGRGRGGGGRRPSPPDMAQVITAMQEAGCLPGDYSRPDLSSCESLSGREKLQCAATSSGFSGASGYDQAAAEAFLDARSSDAAWRSRQKELLAACSSMLVDELPAEQQGAFVLACAAQLTVADCARQRLVTVAEAADAENGEDVAEEVAAMAEGHCFKRGIKYSKDVEDRWRACATDNGLDLNILGGAFMYYMALKKGSDSLPALSAENVTAVDAALDTLEKVSECYSLSSGELGSDGQLNFDQMRANIDSAGGRSELKEAAKKIVTHCEEQDPDDFEDFLDCYVEAHGYACAALKSYAIVSGGRGGRSG